LDSIFCKHTIQKNLKIHWGSEPPDPSLYDYTLGVYAPTLVALLTKHAVVQTSSRD